MTSPSIGAYPTTSPAKQQQQQQQSAAAATARGTLWSVGLRLVSFACTQITLRWVDPIALGKANIDLELTFGFILFFSREGFRLVLTKEWNQRLAYRTRMVHTIVALIAWLWLCTVDTSTSPTSSKSRSDNSNDDDQDYEMWFDYKLSATLYCIAAWMEGMAEPRILKSMYDLRLDHKVCAEGMATVTKTLVTVLALWQLGHQYPVTAFGVAQISYAIVYNIVLYHRISNVEAVMDDTSQSTSFVLLRSQIILFTLQGLFKHALTEGDRILLLLVLTGGYDKGIYALASAYGGMAARLLFQPLEENARLLWSKLVIAERNNDTKQQLLQSYTVLVKLVLFVGLIFAVLGSNYTVILLQIIGGSSRRPAAPVLSAFCVYTLAMALNGMTEAFWYAAAASREQVGKLSLVHCIIGVTSYACLAPIFVSRYGTVGLVMANIFAMLLRSLYALHFAAGYFRLSLPNLIGSILPHPLLLLAFFLTFVVTKWSLWTFLQGEKNILIFHDDDDDVMNATIRSIPEWLVLAGRHVASGVTCLVGIVSLVSTVERSYLQSLRHLHAVKKQIVE